MRLILGIVLTFGVATASAQDFRARVTDAHDGSPLAGVNVTLEGTTTGAATDVDGLVSIAGIPAGPGVLVFSYVGFETLRLPLTFPLADPARVFEVSLEEDHEALEAISVSATRTSRSIADQAVRVETIAGEEIDEKISMEPSNISMLLNESPGIMVQQTSAVSGGASIRIQGLDGRYTQMLKDGFPVYGGFSGGLSLLQVPPLDLAQVEVIKGPSSTLYGGDAIAGLVNLVSKGPDGEPSLDLLINTTSAGGVDAGGFYRARRNRAGTTVLVSANRQQAYDPDDDQFSNLPESRRLTINPRLFFYPSERTTASVGLSGIVEERKGGDMALLTDERFSGIPFLEQNNTARITSQSRIDHRAERYRLTLKNSVSLFDRTIEVPDYRFEGRQIATYSEASVLVDGTHRDLVFGLDLRTDSFRERDVPIARKRDYAHASLGGFVQDTWDVSGRLVLETGLRADWHDAFGAFLLPKVSALLRATPNVSARISGGRGYKAPTIFLKPSEEVAFRDVVPLDDEVVAERSNGGSLDVNYRGVVMERLAVSLNQAVHFTTINHPLIPHRDQAGLRYTNAEDPITTRAFETNIKLSLEHLKLFLGYVHLRARGPDAERHPLTPRHKTYTVLVYEKHGRGRVGLEAYYTGRQHLADGSSTDGFLIMGLMGERRIGRARLFLNLENFLDTKQSNYAPVVRGSRENPLFAEIWAPMDGFVINGGVKLAVLGR
ncbi:MAG: TonB-dependent receptor [Rhodothermales bacterium]|nr:TonB-dependent receptor [Rhodothermales bacterium]MBO6778647.1 TonB-dependent receptor [Rhodothermales bacterium]